MFDHVVNILSSYTTTPRDVYSDKCALRRLCSVGYAYVREGMRFLTERIRTAVLRYGGLIQ